MEDLTTLGAVFLFGEEMFLNFFIIDLYNVGKFMGLGRPSNEDLSILFFFWLQTPLTVSHS